MSPHERDHLKKTRFVGDYTNMIKMLNNLLQVSHFPKKNLYDVITAVVSEKFFGNSRSNDGDLNHEELSKIWQPCVCSGKRNEEMCG